MSNPETVTMMMQAAGYEEIGFERVDAQVLIGNDVEDAIAFQLALGPAGEVYRLFRGRDATPDALLRDQGLLR